ncbi:DUF342 domain-containing protein [Rheinheimera salexigens]|nr:FapA family protein [Rheinheimera salexigens]
MIQKNLEQAGYGRCRIQAEQLTNLLHEYQTLQQKIKSKLKSEANLSYAIAEMVDAEISFEIADEQMQAYAIITTAWGGQSISANKLVKAAQASGIVYGFSKENIIRLVTHASKAEPGAKLKLLIAKGRAVEHGLNSRFEAKIPNMESRRNKPIIQSDEKADLRDFGEIPAVNTGDVVMQRHPPTLGIDGISVTGTAFQAVPGQNVDWNVGEGTEISASDANLLVAARSGLPRVLEAGATVDEVFTVKNVDLTTGHIKFRGSVIINGDITEGMKVIAGGNIFIKGFVEGTLIEAGGDIKINGSIIGHQINLADSTFIYSTELKATGDIQANLAQYAKMSCGGNLYINKQMMHCSVSAAKVYAGPEANPNGKIIGGDFDVDYAIYTGCLGAASSSHILIKLNRLIDPIAEQQQSLRSKISAAKTQMLQNKEQLETLKKLKGSEKIDQRCAELEQEFNDQRDAAIELIDQVKTLELERKTILDQTIIVAKQQLFAAVEVHFGSEKIRTRREYGPSKILLVDAAAVVEPYF